MGHMPANNGGHVYNELTWRPIEMLDLKYFKEPVVLYGLHSPFVKERLNNWAMHHRVVPARSEVLGASSTGS